VSGAQRLLPAADPLAGALGLRGRAARPPSPPPFGLRLRVAELQVRAVPVAVLLRAAGPGPVLRLGPRPLLAGQSVGAQVLRGADQVDGRLLEGPAQVLHGGFTQAGPVRRRAGGVPVSGARRVAGVVVAVGGEEDFGGAFLVRQSGKICRTGERSGVRRVVFLS